SFYCRICFEEKLLSEKCLNDSIHCNPCEKKLQTEYKAIQKGFIMILLADSKKAAKKRLEKGREDAGVFTLTYDQIINKLNKQNYKCYYSGLSMILKPLSEGKMSIDRINDSKGYTD